MSGINININATAGNINAVFNAAASSILGLDNAIKALTASAKTLETAMNSASAAANNLGSNANNSNNAMRNLGSSSAGVTRELLVMGHEAMQGRFSRIPGSLMVLAERMGNVSLATMGLVGALAAAALGAAHLVEWLGRIKAAKGEAEAGAAYFNPGLDQSKIDDMVSSFRQVNGVTTEMAGKTVNAFATMRGATVPLMQAMVDVTKSYAQATGEEIPAAANKLKAAFEEPAEAGKRLYDSLVAGTAGAAAATEKYNNLSGDTAPLERRKLLLDAINSANERAINTASNKPIMAQGIVVPDENPTEGPDMSNSAQLAAEQSAAAAKRQQDMQAAMANMPSGEVDKKQDMTWFEKQQLGADELKDKVMGMATNFKQATMDSDTQLAAFWKKASEQAQSGSKDQAKAWEEYLRFKDAAEGQSLRTSASNAKTEFEIQIGALNAQQAAASGNMQQVMQIEQQKLDLYAQYGKTHTTQYEAELRKQAELTAQYASQEVSAEEAKIKEMERVDNQNLANKSKELNAEVLANEISRNEAINQLKAQITADAAAQQQVLDNLISTLAQGTKAYAAAMNERALLAQNLTNKLATLDAQQDTAATKAAQNQMKSFDAAFQDIGNAGSRAFDSILSGTSSWVQIERQLIGSLVSAVANFGLQMAARWAATELAMTASTTTQNAVRKAQDAGGSGLTQLFATTIAQWLGLETTKTAITTGQNTARTAATTTAAAAQTAAQSSAAVTGQAAQRIANATTIAGDAAVAAAGAFAATASIPIVGPELAPAAGAAAYAQVQAYQGLAQLDVGAWNVPQDMVAQIHKNEMVVPATFAEGMRNGSMGGGSDNSMNINYSPTIHAGGASGSGTPSSISNMLQRSHREMVSSLWSASRNGSLTLRPRAFG